jgi:hypothetical protein
MRRHVVGSDAAPARVLLRKARTRAARGSARWPLRAARQELADGWPFQKWTANEKRGPVS